MRSRSVKTAALCSKYGPERKAFLLETPVCCVCGGPACDVHEILAGCNRQAAFKERCCWLRVCRACHDWLQGEPSKTYQLALKLLSDPVWFDLAAFHRVWGRPETAISPAEVLVSVRQVLTGRLDVYN